MGCGASLLVDRLLGRGFQSLALGQVRARPGAAADRVEWFVTDLLDFAPPGQYDLWHDRSVLHSGTPVSCAGRWHRVAAP